jgi:hypothetical protein
MILFPLFTFWIRLQVFTSAFLAMRQPALISDARPKAEQDRPDDGNPIQYWRSAAAS